MEQDKISPAKKPKRRLLLLIISIVSVLLLTTTTVFVLSVVFKSDQENTYNVPKSADDIVADYIAKDAIAGLSTDLYSQQSNDGATIKYQATGRSYAINALADKSVLFIASASSNQDDTSIIQSQTTTFMEGEGLAKTESPDAADNAPTLFTSSTIICQLISSNMPEISGGFRNFHTIACSDMSTLEQEYSAIDNLLSKLDQADELADFTEATITTASEGNVAYSIINLTATNSAPTLLFAAVDGQWEYIGNLSAGDPQYATDKYIITPEIKAKISDSKYNGLIEKEVY